MSRIYIVLILIVISVDLFGQEIISLTSESDRNIIKNYVDPSSTEDFKLRNNCTTHKEYSNVKVCSKEIDNISYNVFLSKDKKTLERIKESAQLNKFEIHYYYQQLENRDYDFNKEERPDRYMGFAISSEMKEAFKTQIVDDLSVIEVLEHRFWSVSDFSGLAAYNILQQEIEE